jgi:osmotically-inducible protein OsmY
MKTDSQLKHDVNAELEWDPAIDSAHVGVAVDEGVVVISGHLHSHAEKYAVERAVQRVAGVRAIAIEAEVMLEPQHQHSDAEIAAAIETAFRWHAQIPQDRIRVRVEKGRVTLSGEVDWDYQRHNAELVVRPLTGVVQLVNKIALRERKAPEYVAHRIQEALARYAEHQAQQVEVRVEGDVATLRGMVNSWAERETIQAAAWLAPGISRVVNQIQVRP